jgi:hypothetical protein
MRRFPNPFQRAPAARALTLALALILPALSPTTALHAQDPDPDPVPPPAADSLAQARGGVGPGGAFLRAVLVPGWGHASIGSHRRGGVYLAAQAGTAWMLVRTRSRREDARRVVEIRERHVRERLALEGETDPVEIAAALDDDEDVRRARGLQEARSQQFEDWAALGIFMVLLSGVDAFVSAHLQDFPVPVELGVTPLSEGRIEVGARIPLPF